MKSIAIWCTPLAKGSKSVESVELHFNLWKIPNGKISKNRFLDIGIKFSPEENVDKLNLYFPRKIKAGDFEDIVTKLIDKADLVSAIFNENYTVTSEASSKFYQIKKADVSVFDIYKTSTVDITYSNCFEGTIVSINVPKTNRTIYFRFRVKGEYVDSLSAVSRPTNAILESAFSVIEMVDFRVNEIRDLNQDLLEKIRDEGLLRISKQHFFFICSNDEEVVGNHLPYGSCRNLENYRWNNYVDLKNENGNVYLAYHWKDIEKESVAVLIKTKYEKNNWSTIFKYFLVGTAIAITVELISNWFYDFLKDTF